MSSHLSSNLIASFIKKLARISLYVSPDSILYILSLIYNLILKHQSVFGLLYKPNDNEKQALLERLKKRIEDIDNKVKQDIFDEKKEIIKYRIIKYNFIANVKKVETSKFIKSDPYNPDINLDDNTNADKSSLWEIETLLNHYLSDVTLFSRKFEKKFDKAYYNIEEYSENNYSTIISNHLNKDVLKQKSIPLNYKINENFLPSDISLSNSFSFK